MKTGSDIVAFIEDRLLTPDELGLLASLIADEQDYYTVLGVSCTASLDQINRAYCLAVEFFHPAKHRELTRSDGVLHWKLSCAQARVAEAFSVLSSAARRNLYDRARSGRAFAITRSNDEPVEPVAAEVRPRSSPRVGNRRRVERIKVRLPALVTLEHHWRETADSEDVSPLGIRLRLPRAVEPGTLLRIDLPLPVSLRTRPCYDELYTVNGFAIRTTPIDRQHIVAIEFV